MEGGFGLYRRLMGLALGRKSGRAEVERGWPGRTMNTAELLESEGQRHGVAGSGHGGDAALPGEVFHGWRGDRQQGVCERGVFKRAGTLRAEAQGRGAGDARKRHAAKGS
jgi:hypothetical protein